MAIGETISHELWSGPGASSFYAAATELTNVVTQISTILDGQQANAGALLTVWASPTGEKATSANAPYGAWLIKVAAQLTQAANQIQAAGAAFDEARVMTPTPAQFAANNAEFMQLLPLCIFPGVWARILANRTEYATYTVLAATAMSFYTTESAGTVGTIQPLSAPPVSATPLPADPLISARLAGLQPIGQAMSGAINAVAPSAGAALQPVSATTPVLSQLLSQPSDALGQLTQAPTAMTSELTGLPSMASAPMTSGLGSPTAGSGGLGSAGADAASWFGTTPAAGGAVAAALSGGGAGFSGLGATALAPMRGPVSWSSTTNAANPMTGADAAEVAVSRVAEARAAAPMPATSAGMGAPGTMMPSAQQASASARERGQNSTLSAAAVLYRPPRNMPVVTGAAGAQFVAGEEASNRTQ